MSHISDALYNVSFLTTLKDHQVKEAEVLASEMLYIGYHLILKSQGHTNTFDLLE